MLKKAIAGLLIMMAAVIGAGYAEAQGYTYVNGYHRRDGTYVRGHYRTLPDGNLRNNWSTRGNFNPFTGAEGTRDYSYSTGRRSYSDYSSNFEKYSSFGGYSGTIEDPYYRSRRYRW